MPNEMRERLVKLLGNRCCNKQIPCENCEYENFADCHRYALADHLLENGVIVPPCKVGQDLFYLDRYSGEVERDSVKFFTVTRNGIKPILERHNIRFWELYKWGKTVFLTREEAEKALAERSENNAE